MNTVQLADIAFPFGRKNSIPVAPDQVTSEEVVHTHASLEKFSKKKPMASSSHKRSNKKVSSSVQEQICKVDKGSKSGHSGGKSVHECICCVLLELCALGMHKPLHTHVAMYLGYSGFPKNRKAFANIVSSLATSGYVSYQNSKIIQLTPLAIQSSKPIVPFSNNADAQECLKKMVRDAGDCPAKEKTLQIFESLVDGKVLSNILVAKVTD
jgi:hypothetical protein